MNRGRIQALACLAGLACAAPLFAQHPGENRVRLSEPTALVYDGDGIPLLRGTEDFLLRLAANPAGTAFAWDEDRARVKISSTDQPELWLDCADLHPIEAMCEVAPSSGRDRDGTRDSDLEDLDGPLQRGIPTCPGDPRCPRVE